MGLLDWWFGKKEQPGTAPRPTSASCRVGDRVLALWFDDYFYPGTVEAAEGSRARIAYDDGDHASVLCVNVRRPDLNVGGRVFCRVAGGPAFLPAVIRQLTGEKLQVRYDNGEEEWTTISMVRVRRPATPDPEMIPPPAAATSDGGMMPVNMMPNMPMMGMPQQAFAPPQILDAGLLVLNPNWREGDRVLARWADFYWYPGTILAIGDRGFHILYDDGDQRIAPEHNLMPLVVEEGEHVFIRPKNQQQRIYTPATVTRVNGETIDVQTEDGDIETNHRVSRVRLWRCPVGFGSFKFEEGDRVLSMDIDGYTYPAEIVSIDDDKIMVQFLDGPERMVTPELVRRLDLKPDLRVECRWKAGQQYFAGKIAAVVGERFQVAYDDGDEEWTTIRLARFPPQDARIPTT